MPAKRLPCTPFSETGDGWKIDWCSWPVLWPKGMKTSVSGRPVCEVLIRLPRWSPRDAQKGQWVAADGMTWWRSYIRNALCHLAFRLLSCSWFFSPSLMCRRSSKVVTETMASLLIAKTNLLFVQLLERQLSVTNWNSLFGLLYFWMLESAVLYFIPISMSFWI